jgi:hypothetical protein
MPNGRCRMHGGPSPGAPKGNKNAFKHGLYTAEAIAGRRTVSKLMRAARALSESPRKEPLTTARIALHGVDPRILVLLSPAVSPVSGGETGQVKQGK